MRSVGIGTGRAIRRQAPGVFLTLLPWRPSGLVPDIAGPRIYAMAELVRNYVRACGLRRVLVPVPIPGRAAAAIRAGANLAPDHPVGRRTWEDYLAERVGATSRAS